MPMYGRTSTWVVSAVFAVSLLTYVVEQPVQPQTNGATPSVVATTQPEHSSPSVRRSATATPTTTPTATSTPTTRTTLPPSRGSTAISSPVESQTSTVSQDLSGTSSAGAAAPGPS